MTAQARYLSRKRKAKLCGYNGCWCKAKGFYCAFHKEAHRVRMAAARYWVSK